MLYNNAKLMENKKPCKKCGGRLILKPTKKTAAQLRQPYYYTAYYLCEDCKRLYHDEKFKVINKEVSQVPHVSKVAQVIAQKSFIDDENYDAQIWTDGACVFNGQPNARAAWSFVSGETERAGLVEGKQTNNIAEALAIYNALIWATEKKYKKLKIYSDSQITINNIKKSPHLVKANNEIFQNIAQVITNLHLDVTFEKVLGHSGDINNERADKLANTLAVQGSQIA